MKKTKDEMIKELEDEVHHLKDRQKKLEEDIVIYHKIIDHLNEQFNKIKKEVSSSKKNK